MDKKLENIREVDELARYHYDELKMNELLSRYRGNLSEFIDFLSTEWGWKVDINKECICRCSELFAKRMFHEVTGRSCTVEVTRSFLRDKKSCIYHIKMN